MARSERITLRLSPEERERFEEEARKEDLQLSVYLRKKLGLSNLGREPEPVKERPAKASVEDSRPVGSTPTPSAEPESYTYNPEMQKIVDEKRFKQLVAQLQGSRNLSREQAEEEARKRLGLE